MGEIDTSKLSSQEVFLDFMEKTLVHGMLATLHYRLNDCLRNQATYKIDICAESYLMYVSNFLGVKQIL
jgi:hypothetical protein